MNSNILKDKKFLFIGPKTFGYETAIMSELKSMGADVIYQNDRPTEHPWGKGLLRLMPKLGWYYTDKFFLSWLNKHRSEAFDFIFIIKGEGLSPNILKTLKIYYPKIKIFFHLWDSIANAKFTHLKLPFVDDFTSFDPIDCKSIKNARYRPLFFLRNYFKLDSSANLNSTNSIFFIGTLNGDRPKIICDLLTSLHNNISFEYYLFVRSRLELSLRKYIDPALRKLDHSRLFFAPMKKETVVEYMQKCSAVLDIEHPNQTGLTMRTFEVLASGKKLITTNKSIQNHDFYDPTRICIIDRHNPYIPEEFFLSKIKPLPDDFYLKYSLRGWLMDIFNVENMY